jgi:hypothetical protein
LGQQRALESWKVNFVVALTAIGNTGFYLLPDGPFLGCVTLGKSTHLSKPQFQQLESGHTSRKSLMD